MNIFMKKLALAAGVATIALTGTVAVPQAIAQEQAAGASINDGEGRVATKIFGLKPNMLGPVLSPDGTKIAYKLVRGSTDYIVVIDLNKADRKPEVLLQAEEVKKAGDRTAAAWRFVGNDTLVLTMRSRDVFFGDLGDVSRLVAIDLESKKLTELAWDGAAGNGGSILHIDHDNGHIIAQRSSIEERGRTEVIDIDVKTGQYTTVQRYNVEAGSYAVDSKGVVRASSGSDRKSGKTRIMYRSGPDGTLKTVSNSADESYSEDIAFPEIFLDDDMAYATSNHDNYTRLYKINMKTGEMGEPIFEKEGYDLNGLISNYDNSDLVGVSVFDGRSYSHYFEPKRKAVMEFLDESFGKHNARLVSIDKDFTKLIIDVSKPSQRSTYYLYDLETGDFNRLGYQSEYFKDYEFNEMKAVDYTARDGAKIQAIVTYPRHRKEMKNLPVVVMPHGGPFGVFDQVEFGYFPWTQAMAELGYVVIQPNYRGSGGYGADFVKLGRKPEGYGGTMQDDLNDAVTAFAEKGLIDPDRACIMGWSYGGYAAARGAQRDADVWKCSIAGAGVYDFPKMKAFDSRTFGDFGANYQATADDLVSISSARNTDGDWAPILIVAGLQDDRIPIEQSRTLVSRLKGSGKVEGEDFKYVENKLGTHNLPYEQQHIEWLVEAENWLAKHNPAYISSDPDKPIPVVLK